MNFDSITIKRPECYAAWDSFRETGLFTSDDGIEVTLVGDKLELFQQHVRCVRNGKSAQVRGVWDCNTVALALANFRCL